MGLDASVAVWSIKIATYKLLINKFRPPLSMMHTKKYFQLDRLRWEDKNHISYYKLIKEQISQTKALQ